MAEVDESDLKTLKDVAELLGVSYGRLRGFADASGVREMIGAVSVQGVKGVKYPPDAVERFRALLAAQDLGEVEPKTAERWLRRRYVEQAGAARNGHISADAADAQDEVTTAVATLPNLFPPALLAPLDNGTASELTAAMRELTDTLRENAQGTPPDRFYSLAGAAEATGLSQRFIRANCPYVVDGGRRHKYAASDLRALAQGLQRHTPGARPRVIAAQAPAEETE
jgi:hypothetical protein